MRKLWTKFKSWLNYNEVEHFLGQSTDIYDLERRMEILRRKGKYI